MEEFGRSRMNRELVGNEKFSNVDPERSKLIEKTIRKLLFGYELCKDVCQMDRRQVKECCDQYCGKCLRLCYENWSYWIDGRK